MVLVISGDLPVKEVYNYVAANQRRKSFPAPAVIEYAVPPSGKGIKEPAHSAGMEVSRPMLCLGLKDRPTGTWKEAAHREMVAGLLLEIFVGKNSPFYNRLYDDGIIDSTFGVEYSCTPWYSHFIFGGECDTPQLLAEQLLEELNRLRKCGVNRQLLEVNLHKLLGLFIMDLNGLESTVMPVPPTGSRTPTTWPALMACATDRRTWRNSCTAWTWTRPASRWSIPE